MVVFTGCAFTIWHRPPFMGRAGKLVNLLFLYTFYTFIYNMSMNYKYLLKQEGITVTEFASRLNVSRPTLYKMFDQYENNVGLGEPYQSIFDAFFLKERNAMKGNYESRNGNLVVKILENTAVNANGTIIKGSETRGKRDIVCAQVLVGDSNVAKDTIIYFSFYAAQPFTLEDEEVYVVNKQDIKFIKKGEL